jgi:transcriptional regulator with XRE-family HTH domain
MFKHINSRRTPEPDEYSLTSIQGAVFALRECSGMTMDYLSKRLGMTKTQMVNLESRGKPINSELLLRLKHLSEDYELSILAGYFDKQEILLRAHRRTKMRVETTGN